MSVVSATGPAGKCGLLVGDRIIMIEKKYVEHFNHLDVVAEIKKYPTKVQFTVIAAACDPINPDRDEMNNFAFDRIGLL